MAIAREGGREARTDFKVVRSGGEASLLECRLHSGRTHQIRVHLQHFGYPILGDVVYGGRRAGKFSRQMLHAWKLGLDHPRGKERMHFEAPLPEDFEKAMREVIELAGVFRALMALVAIRVMAKRTGNTIMPRNHGSACQGRAKRRSL